MTTIREGKIEAEEKIQLEEGERKIIEEKAKK